MNFSRRAVLISVSAVACLSAAAVYAFATGTDETVAVPVPGAAAARYCRALHKELPARVDGLARHDLRPRSDLTAGWGDPAIVLRCGVPRPSSEREASAYGAEVNGVNWSVEPADGGRIRLTTTLRLAYVEVVLPEKYAHDAGPLTDLAVAVKKTIPEGIA